MPRWPERTEAQRFVEKIVFDNATDCWIWTAAQDGRGYGRFGRKADDGRWIASPAYRYSFELFVGAIPAGHEIHHRCVNPLCVNPDHLEAATPAEHGAAHIALRETCSRGHVWDAANTYINRKGDRMCRGCDAWRQRERRKKNKAVAACL